MLVAGATTAGVLAIAVAAHDAGTLDRVLVATLALLALSSIDAVAPLPAAARELWENATSGRRILELIDREPSVNDPRDPIAPPPGRPTVALEGVTARYSGADEPALRGVDLVLPPGRHVALVGASGAGKTTVTGLLLRFLDPEQGRVTIAGHDARDYRQEDVRETFALAGQDAHVFDATIRANLLVARPDASDADLRRALARVRLDAWVDSLPDGLDTLVGEDGSRLSGGQRQRLTVARALLTDAPGAAPRRADCSPRHGDRRGVRERRPRGIGATIGAAHHAPARGTRPRRRDRQAGRRPHRGADARRQIGTRRGPRLEQWVFSTTKDLSQRKALSGFLQAAEGTESSTGSSEALRERLVRRGRPAPFGSCVGSWATFRAALRSPCSSRGAHSPATSCGRSPFVARS